MNQTSRLMTGPTISDALELLEGVLAPARLESAIAERPYLGAVFLEQGGSEHYANGLLLLAPNLDPAHPEFASSLREVIDLGATAVIVKRPDPTPQSNHGALPTDLADSLLFLEREADWADVAQILRALGSAGSGSVASGIRQGDLFALANTLASIAGGAVSLVDTAGRILGYSTHADQPIDALRRSTTLALHEGYHPRTDAHFLRLSTSASAIYFEGNGSQFGRVALPVRAGGELLGTVWMIQVNPAGATSTRKILDSVEPLVSHHMLRARNTAQTDERRSTDLLRALFEDAKSRRTAAAQLGLSPSTSHTVVCFRLLDRENTRLVFGAQQLLHQAATTAKGQFAWSHCALLDGVIVALIASADESLLRLFAERITQTSGGSAIAGIGRVAETQTSIPRSYRDAVGISQLLSARRQRSVRVGPGDRPTVATLSEVRAELGLARINEILQDSEILEDDEAQRILLHDRLNQSSLAETLLTVLTFQGSVRRAAAALHVHQNTIRYRLDTIRDELGIDLEDAPTRLWVWLRLQGELAT